MPVILQEKATITQTGLTTNLPGKVERKKDEVICAPHCFWVDPKKILYFLFYSGKHNNQSIFAEKKPDSVAILMIKGIFLCQLIIVKMF